MFLDALYDHWWLVPVVFFTAIITAVTGAGGGVLLLGIMGLVLPAGAVIPLHGAVMSVQNGFRGALLWRLVDWKFIGLGVLGSIIGALLAGPVAVSLPEKWLQVLLAVGLLYLVWAPKPKKAFSIPGVKPEFITVISMILIGILTTLIGAAGVLFSAIRRRGGHAKEGVLADQSVLMLVQHLLKVLIFGIAGFVYGPYLGLVMAMILMGLLGTFVGVYLMKRMQTVWFDRLFKISVTCLAVLMLGKVVFS